MFDNYDISEVNSIVLNDSGQKKLLDKMRDEVYPIFGDPTVEQRDLVDSVVSEGYLSSWYSVYNGYEIKPHAFLNGLVADVVGDTHKGIFLKNKLHTHVFIPWTDIYDIKLVSAKD